ncbi:hypothetical protein [Streptomyces sp. NPDC046759]|uniref:hypothetical protein n=1 Tax=Streptomyces sp. NPDC046759 TaxID=3155019 RepID=UPI0033D40C71
MSDQQAAVALTAAAVVAAILVARAAVVHQGVRGRVTGLAHPIRGHTSPSAEKTVAALSNAASCAVREAEQHVHHCWQQLQTRADPPE